MAEWLKLQRYPEGINENSMEPQFTANFNYTGIPRPVQNVGMFQPNNQNFMQTFGPRGPPAQQGGSSEAAMINGNGPGPNFPPYVPYSQWPTNWNTTGFSTSRLGVRHVGVYPPDGSGAVFPFDRSVPPPLPRIAAPTPQQRCISSQDVDGGARKFDVPESLEESDRMWIDSWICHHPRQITARAASVARTEKKMKVWEMKQSLQGCLSLLGELEVLERKLKMGCDKMSDAEWKDQVEETEKKKVMLSESLRVLDEEALSGVRLALLKRGRKRARLRGRRVLDKEMMAARVEKRTRLHLEADMWLEGKQADVDLQKREETLKQEADAVLWEVRRKQSEGRRILSLLSALVKLHHVRMKKNDPAFNPAMTEDKDQFQIIIDKLSSLWERQMSEYEAEERALHVMLRESPGGGGVIGGTRGGRATGDLQRSLRLWESLLFATGLTSQELTMVGVDSSQWLYLRPSKSLDALIENRRQWDQFISTSPLASSIPVGWVIPAEASSEEWKALIGS